MRRLATICVLLVAPLGLAVCARPDPCPDRSPPPQVVALDGRAHTLRFARVQTPDQVRDVGLSGLARDGEGVLWSVSEETHRLVRLGALEGAVVTGESRPLRLTPASLEAEGLAFLPDGRLVLATEGPGERAEDVVLFAALEAPPSPVVAASRVTLSYEAWGLRAPDNQGLEGLCAVDDGLVAVVEAVTDGPERHAPVVRFQPTGAVTSRYLVALTTGTGKLSAVDCRPATTGPDGALDCRAIERHYEVARVVGFELPPPVAGPPRVVRARLLLDLAAHLDPCTNLEGLVWEGDRLVLISDNHGATRRGPSRVLTLTPL